MERGKDNQRPLTQMLSPARSPPFRGEVVSALAYFGLGATEKDPRDYLLDYYQPMGAEVAQMIAGNALLTPEAIKRAIATYADLGVDELILDPTVSDPDQVDRLADVAL